MKKQKIIVVILIILSLLLIGFGLWLLLLKKQVPKEIVYNKEYACNLLVKREKNIISCDLKQKEKEYLILGIKKEKDQYAAFYRFDLLNGDIKELPMTNLPTG